MTTAKATFEEVIDTATKVVESQQAAAQPAQAQAAAPAKAPAEKSMWGSVKGFFTSPTMCTFGMLGASMLAGAVGGVAASEARSRGYLGGHSPAQMLPPSNNGG